MIETLHQAKRESIGRRTERLVEQMNEALELARVAHLRKIPTPTRGAPGRSMQFAKKSGVDFMGFMLSGPREGRAIVMELKHVNEWRFPLSRIEPHQWEELELGNRAKVVALVLVIGPGDSVHPIPFDAIESAKSLGHASIAREWLELFQVRGSNYLARWSR